MIEVVVILCIVYFEVHYILQTVISSKPGNSKHNSQGVIMGKLELIATTKADILSGQDSLLEKGLGSMYDGGFADGGNGLPSGFSQADLDHAVSVALDSAKLESDAALSSALSNAKVVSDQALADLKSSNDQALLDLKSADDALLLEEHTKGEQALAVVKQALDEMTAKEQLEELAVADVKLKIEQVQESFDKIKALFV